FDRSRGGLKRAHDRIAVLLDVRSEHREWIPVVAADERGQRRVDARQVIDRRHGSDLSGISAGLGSAKARHSETRRPRRSVESTEDGDGRRARRVMKSTQRSIDRRRFLKTVPAVAATLATPAAITAQRDSASAPRVGKQALKDAEQIAGLAMSDAE